MPTRDQRYNPFFRQLLFLALLITVGLVILMQLRFFFGSFLGAITIYVVLRPALFYLTEKKHWKSWLASTVLIIAATLVLLGISFLVFKMIASEIPKLNAGNILNSVKDFLNEVSEKIGFTIVPMNILQSTQSYITSFLSSALNATYSFAANLLLMLLVLYFMLARGRKMEEKIFDYLPFKGTSLCLIKHEVKGMIFSNAVGIPVIMIGQFAMACLIYWILGVQQFLFFAFLTAIAGLIPVVGTGIIWLPYAIYMILTGDIWQGVVLAAYGVVVISNTDNVLRIVVMKKGADTHPLVVIFGVILGIPLFGFWGIIFGPLLISGFLLLIKIYFREYELISAEKGISDFKKCKQEETPLDVK